MSCPAMPAALVDPAKRKSTKLGDAAYAHSFNWLASNMPVVTSGNADEVAARQAINGLHEILGKIPHLSVDRVAVGGSLGRRTLVAGDFDVDLLVFINNLKYPSEWTEANKMNLLKQVREWLRKNAYPAVIEEAGTQYDDVLQVMVGDVEVDVLLLPNVASGAGRDRAAQQRQTLLAPLFANAAGAKRDQTREAALAESHTAFVASCPDAVKAVVRLVKAWYKYGVKQQQPEHTAAKRVHATKVPSVALELVVLAAWKQEEAGDPAASGSLQSLVLAAVPMLNVFIRALRLLVAAVEPRRAAVAVDAAPYGCTPQQVQQFAHVWEHDPVRIIHPIDPTCNVARPRKSNPDWHHLAAAARELLAAMERGSLDDLLTRSSLAAALRRLAGIKGMTLPW